MSRTKEQVYEQYRTLSNLQSAVGDKILGLSLGGSGEAIGVADRLNEVLNYLDVIEDDYLRLLDGLPTNISDEEFGLLSSKCLFLLRK